MTRSQMMTEFRKKRNLTIEVMAINCKCSTKLVDMIESNDNEVTHPNIADRIANAYKLPKKIAETLLPVNYRKSSPEYDPDKYKIIPEYGNFSVIPYYGGDVFET